MTRMRNLKLKIKPIAKARPRLGRYGTYTPKKTADYEKAVQLAYRNQFKKEEPFEKPVRIEIDFYFQVPKSYTKKQRLQFVEENKPHTKRPDLDNLVKAVTDALNGFAYKDDSQIYSMIIQKWETLEVSNIEIKIQED